MEKVSIIIPVYNEEQSLPYLYDRLSLLGDKIKKYSLEFLFIDDGSTDDSLKIIKKYRMTDSRVQYISLSRNYGKEVAMGAAFDYVNADATVLIDADLQDPPELIVEMLKYYEEGYDDVYAKRKSRDGESWFKKFSSKKFYEILSKLSDVPIQKDTGDFRLLSRRAVKALKSFPEKERYTKGMFSLIGFKKKAILYDRDPRIAGKTKWNYSKLFNLAIEGITSFSMTPLRISTILGFLIASISFIYLMFIVVKTLVMGVDVPGYASIISITLILGGIQLISLGVIGEYIGRIFIEVKNRPLYFVGETSFLSDEEVVYNEAVTDIDIKS